MRLLRLTPLLLLFLFVAGCDSNDDDGPPEIEGTYTASFQDGNTSGTYRLVIPATDSGSFGLGSDSELAADVAGGGTVNAPITGTGTYDYPNVSITLNINFAGGTESFTVTGTVSESANTMTLRDAEGAELLFSR
jgi:hypothetical protein